MKITQVSPDARRDVNIKQISSDQEICCVLAFKFKKNCAHQNNFD